jgi:hypothetical protein
VPSFEGSWDAGTRQATLISTQTAVLRDDLGAPVETVPFGFLSAASSDGRFVAWTAYAQSGADYGGDEPLQLFVQDRASGETRIITRDISGQPSAFDTDVPAASFSEDGMLIAFHSTAPDLVEGDSSFVRLVRLPVFVCFQRNATSSGGADESWQSNTKSSVLTCSPVLQPGCAASLFQGQGPDIEGAPPAERIVNCAGIKAATVRGINPRAGRLQGGRQKRASLSYL